MKLTKQIVLSCIVFVFAGIATCSTEQSMAATNGDSLELLPRELEVKLALSTLPPYLRSEATVYVLDPAKGYVLERTQIRTASG